MWNVACSGVCGGWLCCECMTHDRTHLKKRCDVTNSAMEYGTHSCAVRHCVAMFYNLPSFPPMCVSSVVHPFPLLCDVLYMRK